MDLSSLKQIARQNPEALFRLAKYLRLNIVGMSARQVAKLIRWRTTRRDILGEERFRR
jgi:hypothetical protein